MISCLQRQKQSFSHFLLENRHWSIWITFFALILRFSLFAYQSGDYIDFLHPWFEELKSAGGLTAIGRPIGDYMVSYIYILAFLTYIPLPDIISIKLVSCIGDILLAVYGAKIIYIASKDLLAARTVYTSLLFLPTVCLNSGAWGQCDSVYTAALLACICCIMQHKPSKAMFAYGIAFAFKLQAIFLAPVLLVLLIKKQVKFRHIMIIPAVYVSVIFPAFLFGRSLIDLLLIYFRQTGTYTQLSLGAPNFYAWLPTMTDTKAITFFGIAFTFVIVSVSVVLLCIKNQSFNALLLLLTAFFYALLVPFLLPRMHERYFYPATILAVICFFAFSKVKMRFIFLICEICSFFVVCRFLFGWSWVNPAWFALPLTAVLLFIITLIRHKKTVFAFDAL